MQPRSSQSVKIQTLNKSEYAQSKNIPNAIQHKKFPPEGNGASEIVKPSLLPIIIR